MVKLRDALGKAMTWSFSLGEKGWLAAACATTIGTMLADPGKRFQMHTLIRQDPYSSTAGFSVINFVQGPLPHDCRHQSPYSVS